MLRILSLILVTLVSGCTITKIPQLANGSQMTGTVRLGYDLMLLQHGKPDSYLAGATATRQCQQWGYATAQPYGNPITTCSLTSGTHCLSHSVILEYQCRGVAFAPAGTITLGY